MDIRTQQTRVKPCSCWGRTKIGICSKWGSRDNRTLKISNLEMSVVREEQRPVAQYTDCELSVFEFELCSSSRLPREAAAAAATEAAVAARRRHLTCKMSVGQTTKRQDDDKDSVSPPPPDGGWGWMVVFGSFMIHVIGSNGRFARVQEIDYFYI
ncbi:unnamed protein product [Brassicogethes aeneus]|uniref:Uncharacterized protein n=1 Tax=Brassicogethes aeneus TaxID=1431903 RepID=A0A9P0B639_BRAAE|nr:unnamed protein product [Brassicogethes aeneus]